MIRNKENFRQNSAKKKFKQVIYLRKGKRTKGKADAKKKRLTNRREKQRNQYNDNKAAKKF
jgi:hypothetical protein